MPVDHRTYSALVPNERDLVGHVAYALYKRDKLKFCEEFLAKHGGTPAGAAELSIFIQSANLKTRLQGYRTEAEGLLETMTEYQLEDAIAQIKADADEKLLRKFSEAKSWRRTIAEALLGSFAVANFWAALVFVVYANKVGIERMAKDIWNVDIGGASQPAKPASSAGQ